MADLNACWNVEYRIFNMNQLKARRYILSPSVVYPTPHNTHTHTHTHIHKHQHTPPNHVTLRHVRCTALCYLTLVCVGRNVTSRYVTLRHVTLWFAKQYYVTSRYVMTLYITISYVTLNYATLSYYPLCYVMLSYVVSHHIASGHVMSRQDHVKSHNITSRLRHVAWRQCYVMSSRQGRVTSWSRHIAPHRIILLYQYINIAYKTRLEMNFDRRKLNNADEIRTLPKNYCKQFNLFVSLCKHG